MLFEQLVKYLLYAAMVAFLLRVAPLREMFGRLPRRQRRFLGTLFALMLIAQVVESKYDSYPIVKWAMYSGFGGETTYFDYEGIRPDGATEPFPVAHLLRIDEPLCPTCSKRLVWRLRGLAVDRYRAESDAERAEITDLYTRTLAAAWRSYASRNPGARYDEVRVWRRHYDATDYEDASSIGREFVWSVPLGGGASDAE